MSQVVCRRLGWELSPADVLRLVRDDRHPVALLGAWAGGSDIVASEPVRVSGDPVPPCPGAPRGTAVFGGGWIGYIGFGDTCWFGYYDHVLRRDRFTGEWTFEALASSETIEHRFAELTGRARSEPRAYSCGDFRLIPSPDEHREAVRQTVDYIRRGDIFQANICLRLETEFQGDPLDAFCRAATRLDPPYAAFIRHNDGAVASLSPELFLRRTGTSVLSQPIKGTARRSSDPATARRQRDQLAGSAKDRAENVMIVDLMRNDLSRVCEPGSVTVPALLRAQAHPGVWHLVSDVRGTLTSGAGDEELIRATFPPGSVTGAPKVRALEIIDELEATPREVYTGAIGYRGPMAGMELNVAIRTFEFRGGRVWLGSGGGITASSDPDREYRECLIKAGPLIEALGGTLGTSPAPAPRRPKPALGVFTSLRVADGRVQDLDGHLARLSRSVRELYGKSLPSELRARLAACLATRPSGRLRLSVRPLGGPLSVTVEVAPLGSAPTAVALRPITISGGLGAHKWRDRYLVSPPGEHLLILDSNGDVLETDRASVFAVIDGELRTPPADGRLLPGVTRAAVLRLADAREAPVSMEDLRRASEVFVTNSVRGVIPVTSLLADAAWPPGPVAARLAAALTTRQLSTLPEATAPEKRRVLRRGDGPSIVLIDNYDSFTYNLAHMFLRAGCHVEVVRNDEVPVADIAAFDPDGIVISPGPGTPSDAGISVETVLTRGPVTPLLGICLGHQAIAAAYGATITTAPHPVHGRPSPVTHDGGGLLTGLPSPFHAARYHSLIVDEATMPADLHVTARGPGGIPMGLRHTRHPVEGLQSHPESILTPHGDLIIANFITSTRRQSPSTSPHPPHAPHAPTPPTGPHLPAGPHLSAGQIRHLRYFTFRVADRGLL